MLLGPEGKRRLTLRGLSNDELLHRYDSELVLRLRAPRNLSDTRKLLGKFKTYLGEYPPSAQLAKSFLAQYADRKERTLYRYAQMLRMFMRWYGEPIDDVKIKVPKSLPPYTEQAEIDKLLEAIGSKKTHKRTIARDLLLVELALKSGMRRMELATLKVRDVHEDFLIVWDGKLKKDRLIPLTQEIATRLRDFIKDKKADAKVFGLGAPSITMKIRQFADKAGLPQFHTHTMRHKFATDLLERGADIKSVQALLGHENLATTEVYLSLTDKRLRDAIDTLSKPRKKTEPGGGPTLQSTTILVIQPHDFNPYTMQFQQPVGRTFVLPLQSNNILLESLEVRTSDPTLSYQVMLFETDLSEDTGPWGKEDLIQIRGPVEQRVFLYQPASPRPYVNRQKEKKLHGAIAVHERSIPLDLLDPAKTKELKAYFTQPVQFTITLRYRASEGSPDDGSEAGVAPRI